MATITVHLLNWHWPGFTHISVMLEYNNNSSHNYMILERWENALPTTHGWHNKDSFTKEYLNLANSEFSFDIEADPQEILIEWSNFKRANGPNIIINNCGDATQWFLQRFAGIPSPSFLSAPLSLNRFVLGIFLPSFIPVGITLPGRIMDNAKFHIETRKNAETLHQYSTLALKMCVAATLLASVSSLFGIVVAATYLGSAAAVAGCTVTGAISTWGLFKSVNTLAAVNLSKELVRDTDEASADQIPVPS